MRKLIDINSLPRKEIFQFFKEYDEPYYGITVDLVCTGAYEFSKEQHFSFFLYYLYLTLDAVNQTEALKYRIEGDDLYLYDVINASATIDRDDGTFGFSIIPFFENLNLFMEKAQQEVGEVRTSEHLFTSDIGQNVIHFSAVPWIKFNNVSHPRHYKTRDSIPKVTYGKIFEEGGDKKIPVSVHVNHALVDGLHVGDFFQILESLMSGRR